MTTQVEISKRIVAINSASSVVQRIISISLFFWVNAYLLRTIEEEEMAPYKLVGSLMIYVPLILMLVGGGLGRFITESYAKGDERGVTQIVSTTFPLCLATGLFVLVVGWFAAWHIDHLLVLDPAYVHDARLMLGIMITMSAIRMSATPFQVGFHVRQKFLWGHVIVLGLELIRVALLFTLLFGIGPRALWVIVAGVPVGLLELVITTKISRRLVPALRFRWSEMRRELIRPILSFGGWITVARVVTVMRETAAPLLLNRYTGSDVAVVNYTNGALPETRLWPNILRPLATIQPALTAMHATGQEERLRRSYLRFSRYVLWLFLLAAIPLGVYREEFWKLYAGVGKGYEKYPESGLVMAILLCKSVVVFAQPVLAQVALAKAENAPMARRAIVIEGAAVLATWFVLSQLGFGAVGAALTTAVASLIGTPLLHWTFGFRLTGVTPARWMKETMFPGLAPAVASAPVFLALWAWSPPDTWVELALHFLAGAAVFATVVFAFCLQPTERQDLWKVMRAMGSWLPERRGGKDAPE